MVLKSVAGCRAASSWIRPSSLISTVVTRASPVDRLEAFLKGGALSQSPSVSQSVCILVLACVLCVSLYEWACVLGGDLAPACSRYTCLLFPHHPHLPAIIAVLFCVIMTITNQLAAEYTLP